MKRLKTKIIKPCLAILLSLPAFGALAENAAIQNLATTQKGFLNEQACFTFDFENTQSDAGFVPYILMKVPADLDVSSPNVSAEFFGGSALAIEDLGVGNAAVDDFNSSPAPTVNADERLLRFVYPLGSLTSGSPPLDTEVCLTLTNDANAPSPLEAGDLQTIELIPGFKFGNDEVNGTAKTYTPQSIDLNPVLVLVKKDNNAPDYERTPGPDYPVNYTIAVDIAKDAMLTEIKLTDVIIDKFQWQSTDISGASGCSVTQSPDADATSGVISNRAAHNLSTANRTLIVSCPTFTGQADNYVEGSITGSEEIIIKFTGYFVDIINENLCVSDDDTENSVSFNAKYQGNWLYTDGSGNPEDLVTAEYEDVTVLPAAVQKSASPTLVKPGDVVTFTLPYQISDYVNTAPDSSTSPTNNAVTQLFTITDTLPDGLTFDSGSVNVSGDGTLDPLTPVVTHNSTSGVTEIVFAFDPDTLKARSNGVITFTATVDERYESTTSSYTGPVKANDDIQNTVLLDYQLANAVACNNPSSAGLKIIKIDRKKTILNIDDPSLRDENNNTIAASPFTAGDVIYYQIEMDIPSGDATLVNMTDTLPLPVHDITSTTLADTVPGNTSSSNTSSDIDVVTSVNDLNSTKYTVFAQYNSAPSTSPISVTTGTTPPSTARYVYIEHYPPLIVKNPANNTVNFNFGTVSVEGLNDPALKLVINIPAIVSDFPFDDGIPQTNVLQVATNNSPGSTSTVKDFVKIEFGAPELNITKGVLSIQDGSGNISPAPTTTPVDGNVTDAGSNTDLTYRITVENTGQADAFHVVVTDTYPSELTCTPASAVIKDSSGVTIASPGTISTSTSVTETTITATLSNDILGTGQGAIAKGGQLFIDIPCSINATNVPNPTGQVIENTAGVTWRSSLDADASEVYAEVTDTATVTMAMPSLSKNIIASSESWTTGNAAAIGEEITYELRYTIPEGKTRAHSSLATFQDVLPAGMQYVAGSAEFYYNADSNGEVTSSGPLTVSTGANGEANKVAITPTSIVVANSGSGGTAATDETTISFNFGTITNNDTDDNKEEIVIRYSALVLNTSGNNRSDVKSNQAFFNYNDGASDRRPWVTKPIKINEPNLQVNKVISPPPANATNEVTYTVTISNPNTNPTVNNVTRAWDIFAEDTLPVGLSGLSLSSATLSRGNVDVSGCWSSSTSGSPAQDSWEFDMTDTDCELSTPDARYLAPNETITIVYTANISQTVSVSDNLNNTVKVRGNSLPSNSNSPAIGNDSGDTNGMRTGNPGSSGAGSGDAGAANDINASSTQTLAITTPTIKKTVADPNLQIGQITTATITVGLPVGTIPALIVKDTLPQGLQYTGGDITVTKTANTAVNGNNFSVNSGTAQSFTSDSVTTSTTAVSGTDPATTSLTFDFGNVVVSNATAAGQTITITYPVQVLNSLDNQRSKVLTNTATLGYTGVDTNPPSDEATITVIEPNLVTSKTAELPMSPTLTVAGETITYTLTIRNEDAAGTAYGVEIQDLLPAALLGSAQQTPAVANFRSITVQSPSSLNATDAKVRLKGTITEVTNALSSTISTTTNTNDTLTFAAIDMPPSSSITITYKAVIANEAVLGQGYTNTVSADYTSAQEVAGVTNDHIRDNADSSEDDSTGVLNNYGEPATATVTLGSTIAIDKSIPAMDTTYTIGEVVTYRLRVSIPEGTSPDVEITDTIPAGMSLVSVADTFTTATNAPITNNISSTEANKVSTSQTGSTLTLDLGDIKNASDGDDSNNYVDVELKLRVDNVAGNQGVDSGTPGAAATTLSNSASVTNGNDDSDKSDIDITVVEPVLGVEKTVNNNTPTLGEIITYTLSVSHQTDSGSDAFNIILTDTLPDGLTYVPSSLTSLACDPSPCVPTAVTGGTQLVFDLGSHLLSATAPKTISYQVKVDSATAVGQGLQNSISGTYASIDNANGKTDGGRNGDTSATGGTNNDYTFSDTATVTPDVNTSLDAQKTVVISNDLDNDGVADPNDTLSYTVTITNTGSEAVTDVVYEDTIPVNTSLVPGTVSSSFVGSNVTEGNTIIVDNIASLAAGASLTVTYDLTVDAGTPAGTLLRNQGLVNSNETTPEPTDQNGVDADGDQPTDIIVGGNPTLENPLQATKVVELWNDADNDNVVTPDDTLRYTIVLENKGATTLTDVSLSDTIPTGLTYVNASNVESSGTVAVTGQMVDWTGISAIASGEFVTLVFDVTVNNPLDNSRGDGDANNETFVNQANVNYTDGGVVKTTLTDGNGDFTDGNQPTTISAVNDAINASPALDVQKRVALINDANNDNFANPSETLRYTVTIVNTGAAPTENARFSDTVPTQTTLIASSIVTDFGAVETSTNANEVKVNLGEINPGQAVKITFDVTINASTGGETASNQASVSADNLDAPVLSDDNGNPDDNGGKPHPTLTPIYDTSSVPSTVIAKSLVATSETDSQDNNVLIGEVMTYKVSVQIPAGARLPEARIVDTLPNGLSFVAGSAQLKRVFSTGLSASANPAGINSAANDTFVAAAVDVAGPAQGEQTLSVFLGDVINSDSEAASYVLQYKVVVENIATNVKDKPLANSATLKYNDSLNQPAQLTPVSETVTVKEPNIVVNKTASPNVILTSGGVVNYTITVMNNGNAPAYDVSITDAMPTNWTLTLPLSSLPMGITDNNSTTSQLNLSLAKLDVDENKTITIAVTAPSGLTEGNNITNTANASWTSLPGANGTSDATPGVAGDEGGERTGATIGTGSNGYTDSDNAIVGVGTPALEKVIVNPKTHYAIGDEITYQVTLSLPPSKTMENMDFVDVLSTGLMYVSDSLSIETNGMIILPNPTQTTDFTRQENQHTAGQEKLSIDFDSIKNNSTTATTDLVLTYRARVENMIENQNNTSLTNAVTVSYTNPGNTSQTIDLSGNTSSLVGEPLLTLDKSITSPTVNLNAGDTVTYGVEVSNTGNITAFDTVLSDTLPDGLENVTALSVSDSSNFTGAVPTFAVSGANNTVWESSAFDLPVGESLTLTFTATLASSVNPGQPIQNQVFAAYNSQSSASDNPNKDNGRGGSLDDDIDQGINEGGPSNPDGIVDNYDVSDSAETFTVANAVQFDKAFVPSTTTTYRIGELVTYRLTLSLEEGTLDNVVITDELPAGLTFVEGTVGFGHTGMITDRTAVTDSGQTITADLGTVTNPANSSDIDDTVTVDIQARVDNIIDNQQGTQLGNNAHVTYDDFDGESVRIDFDDNAELEGNQPLTLTIIEPSLILTKSVTPETVTLGDEMTFTLRVAHDTESADAFDLRIVDTLPTGLSYVAGSASPEPASVSGQTLTFRLPSLTVAAGQTEITYQATLATDATIGESLVNNAQLTYASLSGATGASDNGRNGDDGEGGALNDYANSDSATIMPSDAAFVDAQKTVALTVDNNNNTVVNPGDTLTYTVTLENTGDQPVTNVIFTDTVPDNTTYISNSVVASSADNIDVSAGLITVSYSQLAAGQSVVITFAVTVDANTPAGVDIINQGSVDTDQTVPEKTDVDGFDDDGDEPTIIPVGGDVGSNSELSVSKSYRIVEDTVLPIGTNNVGDVVAYDIIVQNTGDTSLTNVVLEDTVPAGVTVTDVQSSKGSNANAVSNTISIDLGTLAPNEVVTVTITGTLNTVGDMQNQAIVSSDELPDVRSDSDQSTDGDQPTIFPVLDAGLAGSPQLTLDKTMALVSDTNGDNQVNPGELVRVNLVVANTGSAAANNVRLTDDLSQLNATLFDYTVATSQGSIIVTAPALVVNLGTIPAGATATVSFLVNANAVGKVDNTATVSDASGSSVNDSASIPVVEFVPLVAPLGDKSVSANLPNLTWRQVWINPNDRPMLVRVIDDIPANSRFVNGSVACQVTGSSTQIRCEFDPVTQEVIFEGVIGPDQGATTESSAQNEVIIIFTVAVTDVTQQVENQSRAQWDADGNTALDNNGNLSTLSNDPRTDATQDSTIWRPELPPKNSGGTPTPENIPVFSAWQLLTLVLAMLSAGFVFTRRSIR